MSANSLTDALLHHVNRRPRAAALLVESDGGHRVVSWGQLGSAVARSSAEIAARFDDDPQLARRIGHASDNTVADVLIALASMSLGAVEVPIDHRLGDAEIRRRWDRVGGTWIDDAFRRRIAALLDETDHQQLVPAAIDVDAPSLILWTTGTTGDSQGVMLSQRNLCGNAAAKLAAVPQHHDDVRLTVLPLCHAYARTCDLGTWLHSGCVLAVSLGYSGLCRVAPTARPTLINTVPSIAYRMLDEEIPGLDRLRLLGCGGAAISSDAFQRWSDRGVTVIQGYGLTETSPVISSATPENASAGLVGRFVEGWESQIRDGGQLFVRGPHVMLGYWNNDRATSAKIDSRGWLATGDLVECDEATGQLRVLGRADDVIVLDNGTKISPSSIEREIECIAGIRHAMLLARGQLELWCDGNPDDKQTKAAIDRVLKRRPETRPCAVRWFDTPLSDAAGELTAKGTIRRSQILKNRFPSYAGS